MKTNFRLLSLFLIIILGCESNTEDGNHFTSRSETIILTTQKKMGHGSFTDSFSDLEIEQTSPWDKMLPLYAGIPDSLSNLVISTNIMNPHQYLYQSYEAGKVERSVLNHYFRSEEDTLLYYKGEVKAFFSVAFGQNSKNDWVYVLDRNNNQDFSDEELMFFNKESNDFKLSNADSSRNPVCFEYEYFDGKEVQKDSSWIYIFKYWRNYTGYSNFEYRLSEFYYNGVHYEIEMKSYPHTRNYSKYGRLGIKRAGDKVETDIPRIHQLKTGDHLLLGRNYYKIDRISITGDSIFLFKDKNAKKYGGTQIGMKAIDFTGLTLDGQQFKLSDYRGKYVLLDFWGTWCAPCRSELENLKEAYELFKDKNLVIVGIAKDSKEALAEFLETNPLPWSQIPQYGPENNTILKQYNIFGYPATFLINPSGKIISINLRGEQIIHKLRQELYPVDELKQFVLGGNTIFKLKVCDDAPVVYAFVKSDTNPKDRWTVVMYRINGEWIGSLGLKPGNYTYEFFANGINFKDPGNKESKLSKEGGRQVSVLRVANNSNENDPVL